MAFIGAAWSAAAQPLAPPSTPETTPSIIAAKEAVIIDTFAPPVLLQTSLPKYPLRLRQRGQEGWVQLNFMVDTQGSPYDITVIDSSNEGAFEKHAIKAVEKWQYQPAEFAGTAIDAGETTPAWILSSRR